MFTWADHSTVNPSRKTTVNPSGSTVVKTRTKTMANTVLRPEVDLEVTR